VQAPVPADHEVDPAKYDSHLLLAGKYFFSLPFDLLTFVFRYLGESRFDSELVELELALSQQSGDSSPRVGRWQGSWIQYNLLQKSVAQNAAAHSGEFSRQDTSRFARPFMINHLYSDRRHRGTFQSYVGWLLTSKQFLEEHDDLFASHCSTVRRWGVEHERPSMALQLFGDDRENPEKDPDWKEFCGERDRFYFRWRISGMAGPYLPIPIGSQVHADVPISYFIRNQEQTGLYLLPDIIPVPSRDELRLAIEESRHRLAVPEHLAKWFQMIRPQNRAKNQLNRLARVLLLQHYWRLLHTRHHSAIRNAVGKLEAAFAAWLKVSEETIHQDRLQIAQRLGSKWLDRPWPI
jgi:hypothetical protein